ncbi:hypothetical protein F2P79_009965 [Pimephales promelas]|nr:hypothetical protein F2P79_009965 [Pimephales promelas]
MFRGGVRDGPAQPPFLASAVNLQPLGSSSGSTVLLVSALVCESLISTSGQRWIIIGYVERKMCDVFCPSWKVFGVTPVVSLIRSGGTFQFSESAVDLVNGIGVQVGMSLAFKVAPSP